MPQALRTAPAHNPEHEDEAARVARYANWDEPSEDEQAAREREAELAQIEALGQSLLKLRKEAIDARHQCGIEQDWAEDEEFYQSIDSANPEGETNVGKPVSAEGGPIGVPDQAKAANRSSVFIPLTRPYVDAAHARIADMLLPTDEWPFKFKPTPRPTGLTVPELAPKPVAQAAGGMAGMLPAPMAANVQPPATPAPAAVGAMPGAGGQLAAPGATASPAAKLMADPAAAAGMPSQQSPEPSATEKTAEDLACEKAQKRIEDWLTECGFHGEYRKMLENAAKLGTGILKGPVPMVRVSQRRVDGVMQRVEEVVPVSVSIDPRNFFPDPGCGEDVQRGSYVWEFDTLSLRRVQDLQMDPSYIPEQLEAVLREGPLKQGDTPEESPQANAADRQLGKGSTFNTWYFTGMVSREDLEAAGEVGLPEDMDSVPAVVQFINDRVVKAALTPLDEGGFPYDVMPWQRRAGMLWGMGVARQMRTPQRIVNGAARAMMDNAGFTSGPIWAIREDWIKPIDGKMNLTPRKGFKMTKAAPDTAKVSDAISFVNIQAAQQELQAIIQMGMKMAEDATGLPMLLQGQQGAAPDTVGGMTILNNNGSTVLRRIARQSDDCVMERHVRRYYQWLLEDDQVPEDEKGDLQIDCSASTALVDRALEGQTIINLAPILLQDPDVHPSRFRQELLKAYRFDPKRIYMTDAEKAARDANRQPPPPPPQVQAAQIREEAATQRHVMTLEAQAALSQEQRELEIARMEMQWNQLLADIAAGRETLTEQNKVKLFQLTQDLQLQREAMGEKTRLAAMKPPAEPPGRAAPGMAFSQ